MTPEAALNYANKFNLYISAGPNIKANNMNWTVARTPIDTPRGVGLTLEEAIADLLLRESK